MVIQYSKDVKTTWQSLWSSKAFRIYFFLTISIFIVVVHFCTLYMSIWETRKGTTLLDPLLNMLTPIDLSLYIFCVVHTALFLTLILLLDNPKEILKAFQAFSLLLLLRTVSIYFIPLETPPGMIYLNDPFSSLFLNNVHVVTKDLFFSGHISTMCLFIYFTQKKFWKSYLMFTTPVLAGLLLWQHVHYTVDIIGAHFFAFVSCTLVDSLNEKWEYGIDKIKHTQLEYRQ